GEVRPLRAHGWRRAIDRLAVLAGAVELEHVHGRERVVVPRRDRPDGELPLAARRLVAAVVLREEGRDQRVLLVTDDGAERPVQIERPRRLALPLAVAGLYERRGDEGQLPSVRAGDRPERLLERVDAQISAVGGRDHERRGGPEDEAEDAAGDARERVR